MRVADGRELPSARQPGQVQVTLMTPWKPMIIDLVAVVIPGDEVALIMVPNVL